ncbi:DUF523 and DUF1722 domain-containing protein [Mariprofundus erugo]|uniref:DUF523 and DUF1722 domain-containing protein n=2 Tax=Mariprofundus erugo TaxID=2528639 RepID=A0A5R9GP09_9PROT|nr:DUF523 and DUF1722 domain-containing protein [Mariprofundus erugo]
MPQQGRIIMSNTVKPRVIVSRCLGFDACRYNGQMLEDRHVEALKPFVEMITVCPEADMGLGTPRQPVRLVRQDGEVLMLQPSTGRDVTAEMQRYLDRQMAVGTDIDGFLLKGRSPSCGPSSVKIYHGVDKSASFSKGAGLYAEAVMRCHPYAAVEDEGRLRNFHIREAFLMRIFALARLRALLMRPSLADLVRFHASHKLLLMCYHQEMMRQCGRIASNGAHLPLQALVQEYATVFRQALCRQPGQRNIINALYHGYGWISEGLTAAERKLFVDAIEEYRDDRLTLATLQHLLKSYVLRFDHDYLGSQYFLDPYPRALFDLADSGHAA